jgi:hypothetical protein
VRVTAGARVEAGARLAGSPSGDVWVLGETTRRFAVDDAALAPRDRWEQAVQPIFARVCATCHLPRGSSGVDLSTVERWEEKRPLLRRRLVDERSMPPRDHPLDDADREILRAWLDAL